MLVAIRENIAALKKTPPSSPGWLMKACDHGGRPAAATEQRALLVNSGNSTGKEGVPWVQLQLKTGRRSTIRTGAKVGLRDLGR